MSECTHNCSTCSSNCSDRTEPQSFLKEHHKVRYYNLLTSCSLNEHLNDTERRATELEQKLTAQMAASEGVTESLKATDMMSWVRKMNNLKSRVQEIVMKELIFA